MRDMAHPSCFFLTKTLTAVALVLVWLCAAMPVARASDVYTLSDGKTDRTYHLYRPAALDPRMPAALVVMLHGGFGSGQQAEASYNWDREADRQGFVVAYPDGVGRSWNAGGTCCGPSLRKQADDLGFLTQLIQTVSLAEHIDPKRVYLTGISNGAAMAYRYACEGSLPIAAVGSVAGSMSYSCPHPHPTSIIEIHGLQDQNIPFAGGVGSKGVTRVSWLPVAQTLSFFENANNCQSPTIQQREPVRAATWNCDQGRQVELITLADAGHQWPGGKAKNAFMEFVLHLDPPSRALDATSALWAFFKGQRAP